MSETPKTLDDFFGLGADSVEIEMKDMGIQEVEPQVQSLDELFGLPSAQGSASQQVTTSEDKTLDDFFGLVPEESPLVTFNEEGAPVVTEKGYSADDLLEDRFYKPIEDYMVARYGTQNKEMDREKVVDMFLNNMRGFAGGNSVRAISELSFLNGVKPEDMKKVQSAYALYEGMEGLFGDTSGWEKAGIVGDFARSAIFDPVNLLTFGLGKIATSGGMKVANQAAQVTAKKKMQELIVGGMSRKAAIDKAGDVFAALAKDTAKDQQIALFKREAVRDAIGKTVTQKLTSNTALKEFAVTGVADGAVAFGTDYIYQDAMMETLIQDKYNVAQGIISGVGSLVVMGAIAGGAKVIGKGGSAGPAALRLDAKGVKLSQMTSGLKGTKQGVTKSAEPNIWVNSGTELMDKDTDFFIKLMLGDEDNGLQGLASTMVEQGYGWVKRDKDDTITKFMSDVIMEAEPEEFTTFIKDFTEITGNPMGELSKLNQKEFATAFHDKMSGAGQVFQAASTISKIMGRESQGVTLGEAVEFMINGNISTSKTKLDDKVSWLQAKTDIPEGWVGGVQNRLIRLLVSNLSTTWLNVAGYGAASTLNSVSQLSMAVLLNPVKAFAGKKTWKEVTSEISQAGGNTLFKLRNTLDPNATYDQFMKYAAVRPKAVKDLARVLPGGVEDASKMAEGFDPNMMLLGSSSDKFIDFVQKMNLVTAQDSYTKSIEFITQMDKGLRAKFDMGYDEFFKSKDYLKKMATREYSAVEAWAVDETMSTIFSKSYKGRGLLGEAAGFIEDVRNVPGLGMLIPFGRFFNNTIAFMADNSGASLILKGGKSSYSTEELMTRAAISWTAASLLASREGEYIDLGLSWNQELDSSGAVLDEAYEFPYGIYKAAARIIAYLNRDEEVPGEVAKSIADQFVGQLTRNLSASGSSAMQMLETLLNGDGKEIVNLGKDIGGSVGSQIVSAGTRFMDPLNSAVGLVRGKDSYVPDRNQGNKVLRDSFRYIDQFVMGLGIADYEKKYNPTEGAPRQQQTKFISTDREKYLTDLDRVYNMMGIPTYKAAPRSSDARTKNRYNQLFDKLNQKTATQLLENDLFKQGTPKLRKDMFKKLVSENGQKIKNHMALNLEKGDLESSLIIEIDGMGTAKERSDAMEKLGYDSLSDMTYRELSILRTYLDTMSERAVRETVGKIRSK
jgi:hypothetical protein